MIIARLYRLSYLHYVLFVFFLSYPKLFFFYDQIFNNLFTFSEFVIIWFLFIKYKKLCKLGIKFNLCIELEFNVNAYVFSNE